MSERLIFELQSTNGWADVWCHATAVDSAPEGGKYVVARLTCVTRYWDRVDGSRESPELCEDMRLCLPQVIIPIPNLRLLEQEMAAWLKDMHPGRGVQLCDSGDQQLTMSLGLSDDIISSPDKPICTLEYSTGRNHHTIRFGTDETCIWRMHQGLQQWLNGVVERPSG